METESLGMRMFGIGRAIQTLTVQILTWNQAYAAGYYRKAKIMYSKYSEEKNQQE